MLKELAMMFSTKEFFAQPVLPQIIAVTSQQKKTRSFINEVSLWVEEYLSNFDLELKFINFVSLSWSLQMANTHVNTGFVRFSLYF